jgi:Domain of unknown function (DUF4376)
MADDLQEGFSDMFVASKSDVDAIMASMPPFSIDWSEQPDNRWRGCGPTANIQKALTFYGEPMLKQHAAQRRWERETGGVELSGYLIATTRESQAQMSAANAYLQQSGQTFIHWKTLNLGFVDIDTATFVTMANGVSEFIQSCFNMESAIIAGIEAGTITSIEQIEESFRSIAAPSVVITPRRKG